MNYFGSVTRWRDQSFIGVFHVIFLSGSDQVWSKLLGHKMAVVFLMYLLCAITDCPPPVSLNHDSQLAHAGHLLPSASSATEIRHGRSFDGEETDTQRAPEIPAVHTSLGEFRGRLLETRNGRPIAAFEGIPYALPPVGHLRFRNPIPIKWPADGAIFIANKTQNDCLQLDMGRSLTVRGVEDCLYLNVFVPEVSSKSSTKMYLCFVKLCQWLRFYEHLWFT